VQLADESHTLLHLNHQVDFDRSVEGQFGCTDGASGVLAGFAEDVRQQLAGAVDDGGLVGEAGGNILEVLHNRMATETSAKLANLGMTVQARDAAHAAEIRAKLEAAGFKLEG